jgi:hypothetical protein
MESLHSQSSGELATEEADWRDFEASMQTDYQLDYSPMRSAFQLESKNYYLGRAIWKDLRSESQLGEGACVWTHDLSKLKRKQALGVQFPTAFRLDIPHLSAYRERRREGNGAYRKRRKSGAKEQEQRQQGKDEGGGQDGDGLREVAMDTTEEIEKEKESESESESGLRESFLMTTRVKRVRLQKVVGLVVYFTVKFDPSAVYDPYCAPAGASGSLDFEGDAVNQAAEADGETLKTAEAEKVGVVDGDGKEGTIQERESVVVELSTAPGAGYTHWGQHVLLLPKPLVVSGGDVLEGQFAMTRSTDNHRLYNTQLAVRLEQEGNQEGQDGVGGGDAGAGFEVFEYSMS